MPTPRTKPKTTDRPFNLDAIEAEAVGEPFPFDYKGHTYTLPHVQDLDRKVLVAADQGQREAMEELIRFGLGDDYEKFNEQPMKVRTLNALFERWLRHCGLEPGELQASTRS